MNLPDDQKISVWLFHDRPEWPEYYVQKLNQSDEFRARLFRRPSDCLRRVLEGMNDCDVLIIHKDLGKHYHDEWGLNITPDDLVRRIHEEAPWIRVGVNSGEYPDGEKHVLSMGADFYFSPVDLISLWMDEQLRKGMVLPDEQALRGAKVEKPPDEFSTFGRERF